MFIVDSTKNRSSVTHCVRTLFKAKVISRVHVDYQFASYQNRVCDGVENAHKVLWKMEDDNIVFIV